MLRSALPLPLPLLMLVPSLVAADELFVVDEGTFHQSDPSSGAQFGWSVAVSGDWAVVGAPRASVPGSLLAGAAYVFRRQGGEWVEEAKLVAPDSANGASFGSSVAIEGDRIAVGAYTADPGGLDNAGAAYVFARDVGGWSFEANLVDSDAKAGAELGYAIAISGDTVLVGAVLDPLQGKLGAVSAFVRSGTSWTQQAKFRPTTDAGTFGAAIHLDGDTALIGAPSHNPFGFPGMGAAYVYERNAGVWSESAMLLASDAATQSNFGSAVTFAGTTALIGAPNADLSGPFTNEGAVYVFEGAGSSWTETEKWIASDVQPADLFGQTIALDGDVAIVGANWSSSFTSNVGAAYVFERLAGAWTEHEKLLLANYQSGDLFSKAVALDGTHALVGAYGDLSGGSTASYELLQCAGAIPPAEVARAGSPPNPDALLPGLSGPPRVGYVWDPIVDHAGFVHAPFGDRLVVGVGSDNQATPYGTLLVDLTQPLLLFSAQAGDPFELPIPASCHLAGAQLHAQAAALGLEPALTNALDVVIGTP